MIGEILLKIIEVQQRKDLFDKAVNVFGNSGEANKTTSFMKTACFILAKQRMNYRGFILHLLKKKL